MSFATESVGGGERHAKRVVLEPRARRLSGSGRSGAWWRDFIVRASGVEAGRPRLWAANDAFWFEPWGGAKALRLTEHQPGLLFSSNGEALDLRKSPPTYANIALHDDERPACEA